MSFVPRDMFAKPKAFGKTTAVLAPAEGIRPTDRRYRAALVQHVLAQRVDEKINEDETSIEEYLEPLEDVPGLSVSRMGRVIRGTQRANLSDLAFWVGEFPSIAKHLATAIAAWDPDAKS